jgi:DNA-3-methyladenine glycosylase I
MSGEQTRATGEAGSENPAGAADSGAAVAGPDGLLRCPWALSAEDYLVYHDEEWGRPVHGDDALYERLCLEAFQSGLSWITILRRREGFRAAFADFKIASVADFTDTDRERLLADTGIIRNRAKIDATLANAREFADWSPGELDALIWSYAPEPASRPAPRTLADVPAVTGESTALSKTLKKRGVRFVGPTTAYALMQACGLVDDHLAGCVARGRAGEVTGTSPPGPAGGRTAPIAPGSAASPC